MTVPSLYAEQTAWQDQIRASRFEDLPHTAAIPYWPQTDTKIFYFVRLFSGRRRPGDVHDWIHHYGQQSGTHFQVLSLDTAVAPFLGDLHPTSQSCQHLFQLYRAGRIAATIAGSPCETFTEARHTPPPEDYQGKRWPRPLRSAARLFGLQGLSRKELMQTNLGSVFFLMTMNTLALHLHHGGLFIAEHPAPPQDASRASIWTAAVTMLLRQHPEVRLHVLPQYKWGAESVKPTGFLVFQLPMFIADMYSCADRNATKPTQAAIGLDPDSCQFRTAKLKEYPTQLCAGLAKAVTSEIRRRSLQGDCRQLEDSLPAPVQQWLADVLQTGRLIRKDAHWLPDYQPREA